MLQCPYCKKGIGLKPIHVEIIALIKEMPLNIFQISKRLGFSYSWVYFNVMEMERHGLVKIVSKYNRKIVHLKE